jgi:hypothetical protein
MEALMKKTIILLLVLTFLSVAAHAYIRDARIDRESVGYGYWDHNPDTSFSVKQDICNQIFYEKLIDESSSFGLLINREHIYERDTDIWLSKIFISDADYYYDEISYNRNFFRNDIFASAWVIGAYYYESSTGRNESFPNLGVALSIKPLPFMYLRANLVLIRMFGFSAAFDLPYNLELEGMYSLSGPIVKLSYKL